MPEELDYHQCHFCGEWVKNGLDPEGKRHWLSDCRPDLVEHEPGELCTWQGDPSQGHRNCYAYAKPRSEPGQPRYEWGTEHKYFYPDGPM